MSNHVAKATDLEAISRFWEQERAAMPERNLRLSSEHAKHVDEIAHHQAARATIVFTCMDERTALVEDALGLIPGEAFVHASGGGRLDIASFETIFSPVLAEAERANRPTVIYLVLHEATGEPDKGCAAFKNDLPAQVAYFNALSKEISERHSSVYVHVVKLDSTTYGLSPVAIDGRDEIGSAIVAGGGALKFRATQTAHAGYGIYIGDCYRAWVPEHNLYFRLSSRNPDIAGNVGIALSVMGHHSEVDLSTTPIVMQVDYPQFADAAATEAARKNTDAAMALALASEDVKAKLSEGTMHIVKSRTEVASWQGEIIG